MISSLFLFLPHSPAQMLSVASSAPSSLLFRNFRTFLTFLIFLQIMPESPQACLWGEGHPAKQGFLGGGQPTNSSLLAA